MNLFDLSFVLLLANFAQKSRNLEDLADVLSEFELPTIIAAGRPSGAKTDELSGAPDHPVRGCQMVRAPFFCQFFFLKIFFWAFLSRRFSDFGDFVFTGRPRHPL